MFQFNTIQKGLKGRNIISTEDLSIPEIKEVLSLAKDMKRNRFSSKFTDVLKHKTFLMFFYNPSVRTRQSFEAAMTELGGHAQFLEPKSMRLKTKKSAGETIEDAAKVMSRYAAGIGIRILEDKITKYGEGDWLIREYAKFADVPVLSMAHDKFHPFQGLADIMGLQEYFDEVKGKKLLMTWAHGALARSWCSIQENLLISSRLGMSINLAHPEGYELDKEVIEKTKKYCEENGQEFKITNEVEKGYNNVNVVYSRNWMSPNAYKNGILQKELEIKKSMKYTKWICDSRKMKYTDNAVFIHPMPVDRGNEVSDEVASGKNSLIYEIAENRLHVQKALLALTMC